MELEAIRDKLKNYQVLYTHHAVSRITDEKRGISPNLVISKIKKPNSLIHFEAQSKASTIKYYKLWFKLSHNYNLVVVVLFEEKEKRILIITTYITKMKGSIKFG